MGGSVICVSAYVCVVLCAVGDKGDSVFSSGESNASLYNIAKINKYSEFVVEVCIEGCTDWCIDWCIEGCIDWCIDPYNSFLISSLISDFLTHF